MKRIAKLDKLLRSKNINGSIIELDNFIGEVCNYGDEMDNLTEPQKLFYLNQNLEREVNNGGFHQYFLNSSGDFVHETIVSLNIIGASHTAKVLQQAIDQFPGKIVPKERIERETIIEKIEDAATKAWHDLDEEFFKYKDDLNTLNIRYVELNKDLF